MISLNHIVYDILELTRGGTISDDIKVDERQVEYLINNQRALLIRNEYNKPGRTIDHNIVQDLGCLELEEAKPEDCCIETNGCVVLRTKDIIPNTIELHDKTSITRVGPVNKTANSFSFMPYERAVRSGYGKYNSKLTFAYFLNNRIYLKTGSFSGSTIDYINVRGVFEDPTEAAAFEDCDGTKCFSRDDKYPINGWMVPYIKEQILRQLGVSMQTPTDTANDAKEDLNKQ